MAWTGSALQVSVARVCNASLNSWLKKNGLLIELRIAIGIQMATARDCPEHPHSVNTKLEVA